MDCSVFMRISGHGGRSTALNFPAHNSRRSGPRWPSSLDAAKPESFKWANIINCLSPSSMPIPQDSIKQLMTLLRALNR